ncbi:pyridoxal phosphate-dependent class II aminotransferase [Clostridiales bacterium COT073_COT-073]|nr:pyridoxal phosphate-dependent class II aminotransferase [Clostridiales bacterium COT073_COT-073]
MNSFHGSDIEKIAAQYHVLPENLLNFGVNANPLGLSNLVKTALSANIELISQYPDPAYGQLKHAISRYVNVDFNWILPANGTSELIYQIIRHFAPKKAILYTPTYSEYAHEIKKQGGEILELPLVAENNFEFPAELYYSQLATADFVLLCNPNNPTATLLRTDELKPLIAAAWQKKIPFVIDETYIEFTDDLQTYSAVSLLKEFDNLIILRGFSKFFAAPGLRLGYGLLADPVIKSKLENNYPWGIHALAALAGQLFLEDTAYITAAQNYMTEERQRIFDFLNHCPDLTVYPTKINFFLVRLHHHNATELFFFLLRQGLLIRNFHDEIGPGFFRFCMLGKEDNTRLLTTLQNFLKESPVV